MAEGTTLWIDDETKSGLKKLAKANERSAAAQLRWMVKRELEMLEASKEENQPKSEK